jgi:hypothetical protein
MKPLCSYKIMIKDYKNTFDTCKKCEEDLKKCLKNNEYNINFCRNERKTYEYCLLEQKEYKKLLKD